MRSTLVTAASVVFFGLGAPAGAQISQPNLNPTSPGTDSTGPSGNPARGRPQDSLPLPTDNRPLPPDFDTRYPREPRVLPTPNNMPLPDPRLDPQPEAESPEQSGL